VGGRPEKVDPLLVVATDPATVALVAKDLVLHVGHRKEKPLSSNKRQCVEVHLRLECAAIGPGQLQRVRHDLRHVADKRRALRVLIVDELRITL
jgi:hypothetical protein